jgi:hypothetical protein
LKNNQQATFTEEKEGRKTCSIDANMFLKRRMIHGS